jgi:hypothetical protein
MLKNAKVGEYVFFKTRIVGRNGGTHKGKSLVTTSPGNDESEKTGIRESNLNSLGRFKETVWAESELAFHEAKYMKQNSKDRNFV